MEYGGVCPECLCDIGSCTCTSENIEQKADSAALAKDFETVDYYIRHGEYSPAVQEAWKRLSGALFCGANNNRSDEIALLEQAAVAIKHSTLYGASDTLRALNERIAQLRAMR